MKRVILLIGLILNTILTFAQATVDVKIDTGCPHTSFPMLNCCWA